MSQLVKLGSLWKGKDKDGKPMMSGSISESTRILVLANGYKREEKQPDYIVYLVNREKDKDKDDSAKPSPTSEDVPF